MPLARRLRAALVVLLVSAGAARADPFADAARGLDARSYDAKLAAVDAVAATGDPRAPALLAAFADGRLFRTEDEPPRLVTGERAGRSYAVRDALTGEDLGTRGSRDLDKITVNNRVRNAVTAALGRLDLADPDPARRLAAVDGLIRDGGREEAERLRGALGREADPEVRERMAFGLAVLDLNAGDRPKHLAAIDALSGRLDPEAREALGAFLSGEAARADPEARAAAEAALAAVDRKLGVLDFGLNLYQGISLGSILLLAAIGLAITFGVMGVINMAHGEMIMLGAYTTFVVQQAFGSSLPPAFQPYYLAAAVPAAFLVAGAVGVLIERGVIRFLYRRPLESLLATWGVSLILQQAVRVLFGATNKAVANPPWMTGGFEIAGGAVLTYNRLVIILFCLAVLAAIAVVLRRTSFGLHLRAVTQNREMAAAMGIDTARVNALTFGLGSGVAGMAGVALSQVGNVSPNLGTQYIVDSFMVVVFGGVGQLAGTFTAAMTLGVVNKLLEPAAGAVLGKVAVLVLLILFIQFRPRGLFVQRGRSAEA